VAEDEDAFRLDRERLRAAFDRASAGYEAAAALQARVSTELLERLTAFDFSPSVVLDLGAGTGRVTRELKRRYPRALVIALDLSPGMLREARRTRTRSPGASSGSGRATCACSCPRCARPLW